MNGGAKRSPTCSLSLAAALVLAVGGCGDGGGGSIEGPDDSDLGTIQVTAQTSAATVEAALDPDGYSVVVGSQTKPIPSAGSVTFSGVSPGEHTVELQKLQDNCTTPDTPAEATVVAGGTAQVAFQVTCWPPATGRIVFTSTRTGVEEVFVVNADGTGLVQVTTGASLWPAWSPDDTRIAFILYPEGLQEDGDLYIINSDGTGLTQLTSSDDWDRTPSWSPDGSKIAFARGANISGPVDIYIMDLEGSGEVVQLTDHPADEYFPAWSPDGSKILFSTDRDGNGEVYVMNADGSAPLNLTNNPAADGASIGAWSPDGTKILFNSGRDGNGELYVMDADGSDQVRVTYSPGPEYQAVWSSDGTRIAFRWGPYGDIFVAYRDGTGAVEITHAGEALNRFPHWTHGPAGFGATPSGMPGIQIGVGEHR